MKVFGKDIIDLNELKAELVSIINKAVKIINEWGENRSARSGLLKDGRLTWAHMYSLVPLTPWEKAKQDKIGKMRNTPGAASALGSKTTTDTSVKKIPIVSMNPANEQWLGALGLLDEPEKCDVDEEEEEEEEEKEEGSCEWEQGLSAFET